MEENKRRILDYLEESVRPVEIFEAAGALNMEADEALSALEALRKEGRVALTKKKKYALPKQIGLLSGRVMATAKGALFVRVAAGEKDVFLDCGKQLAMDGDLVLLRLTETGERPRGSLEEILQRAHETLTGILSIKPQEQARKGKKKAAGRSKKKKDRPETLYRASAVPIDRHLALDIDVEGELMGAANGDLVTLKVTRWPSAHRRMAASIQAVLGPSEQPSVRMRALVGEHQLPDSFSEAALRQAAALPGQVMEQELEGRRDLRGLTLFTIDGADAQDFDDAVSLQKQDGDWVLGVHIADVSHYVTDLCAIDRDALERGTSVYLPGLTIPMLPEALCNNLCSLRPDVDRLAISCMMRMNGSQVMDYEIVPSVIHSRARLVYDDVNRMLAGQDNTVPEALHGILKDMAALSQEIRRARTARGSLDFDLDEAQISLNEEGEPVGVSARERGVAHKMIEDFMIAANETVARHARNCELPFLYRVHGAPDGEKLEALSVFLNGLNLSARFGNPPHPNQLQRVLNMVEGRSEAPVVSRVMLRALKRAEYSPEPKGHFGLAAKDYCHFTSPIRRYPDLVVHRMLKLQLSGGMERKAHELWEGRMPELARQCSDTEQRATQAERDADDLMCAYYMSGHIGECFEGVVSGVTAWGAYVALENTVEGLVHVKDMDDYYEFNEAQYCLIGERTRKVIRLGDRVRVRVDRVDLRAAQIGFLLEEEE